MSAKDFGRRDFHKLTLAAFSGALAGTMAGCEKTPSPAAKPAAAPPGPSPAASTELVLTDKQVELLTDDIHTCRGLNTCKGKGRSKDNECAGQGTCASVADSSCSGQNECATLGGCGETAGLNDCKGKGGCHVPLMDDAWAKARAAFEAAMKKVGKEVGPAPMPEKS
jgi:hypothetical protein